MPAEQIVFNNMLGFAVFFISLIRKVPANRAEHQMYLVTR